MSSKKTAKDASASRALTTATATATATAPAAAPGVRQQRKAETRAQLKQAARALFAERGFAATQVADITRRVGAAYGTFYVHFADKDVLLDELLAEYNAALLGRLERAFDPAQALSDPVAAARRLAEACLEHWRRERGLVTAFVQRAGLDGSIAGLRDGLSPPAAQFLATRLGALARALGSALGPEDAELVAHAVLGMWSRIGLRYLFGAGLGRARAADLLATMTIGALRAAIPELQEAAR
ncbi:MAG: TetR/AcrR family transcriptional regulator [Deltaproteobacteria bacterium]|nr:TetR/AcrR family transcriptional regulator [Deltaproteobacteria bacterium]